jgi:hypothetical protein
MNLIRLAITAALISVLVLLVCGCTSAFQGIRFRAQSPNIDEAFRKLSLAVTTDGFPVGAVDQVGHRMESGWRPLLEKELSDTERRSGAETIEGKITLKLEVRGKLYDVFVTPEVRETIAGKIGPAVVAGTRHPLRVKWETALSRLLEREAKEED